jgi:hypothetical protein
MDPGLLLRAGMIASRLYHRRPVIPALTDHLEDKGGVIGAEHNSQKLWPDRAEICPVLCSKQIKAD